MKIAVFVDAGYLYRASYRIVYGEDPTRGLRDMEFDDAAALAEIRTFVFKVEGGNATLVRIYWYGASPNYYPEDQHFKTASYNDVKVRLGVLRGEPGGGYRQKGVDSLIVQDIIELAQHHAIDAAILLAGDEDLLIGITRAQSFGVRIHLLGIGTDSTSQMLRHESDVFYSWGPDTVRSWVAKRCAEAVVKSQRPQIDFPTTNVQWGAICNTLLSEFSLSQPDLLEQICGQRIRWDTWRRFIRLTEGMVGDSLSPAQSCAARELFRTHLTAQRKG